jgi:hypothetical protein
MIIGYRVINYFYDMRIKSLTFLFTKEINVLLLSYGTGDQKMKRGDDGPSG